MKLSLLLSAAVALLASAATTVVAIDSEVSTTSAANLRGLFFVASYIFICFIHCVVSNLIDFSILLQDGLDYTGYSEDYDLYSSPDEFDSPSGDYEDSYDAKMWDYDWDDARDRPVRTRCGRNEERRNGRCVCRRNFSRDRRGDCTRVEDRCGRNERRRNGRCVCDPGFSRDRTGDCTRNSGGAVGMRCGGQRRPSCRGRSQEARCW